MGDLNEAHAVHFLPFLISSPSEFSEKAAIIFSNRLQNSNYLEDALDGQAVLDIISNMKLEDYSLRSQFIDEVL